MKAGRDLPRSEAEIALIRKGALFVDAGLQEARKAIRADASTPSIVESICKAVRTAGCEADPDIRIASGFPLSREQVDDRIYGASTLRSSELASVWISGVHRNVAFAGERTFPVGPPSGKARAYLAHLSEAADWAIDSIEPGKRRRYIPTETRGRLLSVRGSGIGTTLGGPPAIEPGAWVELTPGMAIHLEVTLACATFGTGAISHMILLGADSVERLTRFATS